nr:MAG TPA: hypothetical protein [Caudoviricetes sp.]
MVEQGIHIDLRVSARITTIKMDQLPQGLNYF